MARYSNYFLCICHCCQFSLNFSTTWFPVFLAFSDFPFFFYFLLNSGDWNMAQVCTFSHLCTILHVFELCIFVGIFRRVCLGLSSFQSGIYESMECYGSWCGGMRINMGGSMSLAGFDRFLEMGFLYILRSLLLTVLDHQLCTQMRIDVRLPWPSFGIPPALRIA